MKGVLSFRQTLACILALVCLFSAARAESALSPDGSKALSTEKGGEIKLWDSTTGKVLRVFRGHQGHVTSLAFSSDGKSFLSGGQDGTIRLWSVTDGSEVWAVNWEGDKKYPLLPQYGNDVKYVAFMPDGANVFSAQRDGTLTLWDAQSGKEVRAFNTARGAWSANLSADGKTAVLTSPDEDERWTVQVWDVAAGRQVKSFKDTSIAMYAAFLPGGKTLLTAGKDSLRLWDLEAGRLLRTLRNPTLINSVALSPDGKIALVGAAYGGNGVITVWDVGNAKIARRLRGHTDRVSELSLSSDSVLALSGGHDQPLIKWNVLTGRILLKIKTR